MNAYRIIRYFAAAVCLFYGFAKLNGSQFTILDSELDKPMGQVSGFWLTWYYFGYSSIYGNLIASVQVLLGIALTFRRTALIAACGLIPVFANIILVDLFFQIDLGALLVACLTMAALCSIVFHHKDELIEVLWVRQNAAFGNAPSPALAWILRPTMVIAAAVFTYWGANYNNRLPTPIDGSWEVTRSDGAAFVSPQRVFFEYNRAFMVVLKQPDGSYETHHFEVVPESGELRLWERWMGKGDLLFEGTYRQQGDDYLTISGEWRKQPVELELTRR